MRYFTWKLNSVSYILWMVVANKYMPKVSNRNTRIRSEICSKLSLKKSLRRHWYRSVGFIVNFEHIPHFIEFILWDWSFNISTIFRLRWIQVPLIYGKDFLKVKYLQEVAYTAPCLLFLLLLFFRFFKKISKLECVSITFFERHL